MSDYVSLAVALLLIFCAGLGLRWVLTLVRVPPRVATTVSATLALLTAGWVILFALAMRNP